MLSLILKGSSICVFAIMLLTDTNEKIKEIMQNIKEPDKEVKALIKKKNFSSEKFSENLKILLVEAENLETLPYPEKEFNELAKQLNSKLQKVAKSLDQNNRQKALESWREVKNICYECHNEYK